jgi:DNA-binding response OmpR family regulator
MPPSTQLLVVDDNVLFRESLFARLQAAGYEAAWASNGAEALDFCRRQRVELVIADWIMPGMDGLELCQALKADTVLRQIYVILLTARETLPDKVRALDSGADEYLVKPCAGEEILARVRAGLRIRRLQEELAAMEWRLATRELAAALGHAINNPLTVIANYLELMEQRVRTGVGEDVTEVLTGAHREVDRIVRVVRRLVNLREPRRIPSVLGLNMTDLTGDV